MEVIFLFEPTKNCVDGLLWQAHEGVRGVFLRPYAGEGNGRCAGAAACALYGNALKRTAVGCRFLALSGEVGGGVYDVPWDVSTDPSHGNGDPWDGF